MKFKYTVLLAATIGLVACKKSIDVKPVTFEVMSKANNGQPTNTFGLSDTINYQFTGSPDVITFYSGAVGQRYELRDRTSANGTPQLQFTSLRANGTQPNSLQLLISTDFAGVVAKSKSLAGVITRDTAATNVNIAAATWTDITSRATLSTGTATSSGIVDLSDYAAQGKPVFIAFKYKATAGSIQNKWTISTLSLNNVLSDGTVYTQANFANSTQSITNYGVGTPGLGWLSIYDINLNANKYAWAYTAAEGTGGSLVVTGATNIGAATADAESWAILGAVDLRKVTPDAGVGIKVATALLNSFTSVGAYSTSGNYTATFVGSNNSVDNMSSAVKQVPITIKP